MVLTLGLKGWWEHGNVNCFIQYLGSADIVETCPPKGRSVVSNDNFKDLCLLSPPHSKLGIMKSHSVFEFWYMYDNLLGCLNMYGDFIMGKHMY